MLNVVFPLKITKSSPPIWQIIGFAPDALGNIAPERAEQLNRELDGMTLSFVDADRWIATYDRACAMIVVSRRAVEIVWCAAYAYYVFFKRVIETGRNDYKEPRIVYLRKDPVVSAAMDLYHWAVVEGVCNVGSEWPQSRPQPVVPARITSDNCSYEAVAGEFTLVALGHLLHHEFAHHLQRVEGSIVDRSLSQEIEKEADNVVADWIFEGVDKESKGFVKRLFGPAIAFCLLTGLELERIHATGAPIDQGARGHPLGHRRLAATLERFDLGRGHLLYEFCVAVLRLHMVNVGMEIQQVFHEDFREEFEACIDTIEMWLGQRSIKR